MKTTIRKKTDIKGRKLIVSPPSMEGAFQVVTVNKRRKNKYNPASEEIKLKCKDALAIESSNDSDGLWRIDR